MTLSPEQTRALDAIHKWLKSSTKQCFLLAGYAGTGKTTLLQHFINAQKDIVTACAPTGKAASVLSQKLINARVTTIHRAIYTPLSPSTNTLDSLEAELVNNPENLDLRLAIAEEKQRLSQQDLRFSLKAEATISPNQLVIIDEASMVTRKMRKDLENTGARILFVGDPGQLPPVQDIGFFEHNRPDALLEEVHRQAKESAIILASMRVRAGAAVAPTEAIGSFRKIPKTALESSEWLLFDQVLTGTNEVRRRINRFFRSKKGYTSWWPENGDKLICLKNDSDAEVPFINGVQASALNRFLFNADYQELQGDILYEGRILRTNAFYRYPFQAHYDPQAVEEPWASRQGFCEFDYAYAITVHKSQGSEWPRVLLADDGMKAGDREFRKKWLYTAITRAQEELVWLY